MTSRVLECTHDGVDYHAIVVPLKKWGPRGQSSRVEVHERLPSGDWTPLPMKLMWRSRLAHSLFTSWPPETVDALVSDGGYLTLEYRDSWIPFEEPVMPFGLDRESQWRARFVRNRGEWRLKRVRHLDYAGPDRPPMPKHK